jgi:hypothetical protein
LLHLVDLRRRLFALRRLQASEFTALVPFDDKNGEPIEPPVVLHGLPARYFYFGVILYLWPVPLHAWRVRVDYAPRLKPTPWASSPARPNRTYS